MEVLQIGNGACKCKRLCITNFTHLDCFNEVIILLNLWEALGGINPAPHISMPMIPNNLLETNLTNKGRCTSLRPCASIWNQFDLTSTLFFDQSIVFFVFHVRRDCELLKIWEFMEWWFCYLGPPTWIDG
jgi:hypothetical protein